MAHLDRGYRRLRVAYGVWSASSWSNRRYHGLSNANRIASIRIFTNPFQVRARR